MTLKQRLKNMSDTNLLLSVTIGIFIVMYIIAIAGWGDIFANPTSFFQSLNLISPKIIVCIGLSIVMISGSIDISVGGVMGLVTMVCAIYLENKGGNVWVAVLISLAIGLAFGIVQGFLIAYLEIQPFIVTLAGMFFARGASTIISDVQLNIRTNEAFNAIKAFSIKLPIGGTIRNTFVPAKMELDTVIMLIVLVIAFVALQWTKAGRALYAVGGNQQSALMLGINPKKTKFFAHISCSLLAGIAGFAFLLHYGNGAANNAMGFEMEAIAASIIGGTLLSGGVGNVIGTFFGALSVHTIRLIVSAVGLSEPWWTNITIAVMICVFLVIQSIIIANKRKV